MMLTLIASALVLGQNATVATDINAPAGSIYQFRMKNIDGKEVPLEKFKGKVLLVVNVASKCGLTPQYEALQSLYKSYHDEGFEILGFPANDFRGQEPGSNEEIKQFCTANYGVTFPMFSKITVLGDNTNPLYKWLIASSDRQDPIEWNFAKFLVDKHGKVIHRFAPKTTPNDPELVAAVETALKQR